MATTYFNVPAGTTSSVMPVNPQISVAATPAVLGGSVLLEFSKDGRTTWTPWTYGTISTGGSFRPDTAGYIRVTATTQAATVLLVDMAFANNQLLSQIANANNVMASSNSTAEQTLLSIRIPPNFLPANWHMTVIITASYTNNANSKVLNVRWNGISGTSMFTSPSLASTLNYVALCNISGRGDGQSIIGFGPGTAGGAGTSTTAFSTLTRDYINQESELVITVTKATGSDTFQLESVLIQLY